MTTEYAEEAEAATGSTSFYGLHFVDIQATESLFVQCELSF